MERAVVADRIPGRIRRLHPGAGNGLCHALTAGLIRRPRAAIRRPAEEFL
jgi:hypothetical protein